MQTGKDIPALTGLRGVAATYVVFYHYVPLYGLNLNPVEVFLGHVYLAVDLFFLLSGFVMAHNYRHLFEEKLTFSYYFVFLGRRIARIYPLYFVLTMIAFLMHAYSLSDFQPVPSAGATLLYNLFMVQNWWGNAASLDIPGWSLSTEWAVYLMFPVLVSLTLFRGKVSAIIMASVAIFILMELCFGPGSVHMASPWELLNVWRPRLGLSLCRCFADFTLGLVCYRIATAEMGKVIGRSRSVSWWLTILILILLCVKRTDLPIVLLLAGFILTSTFGISLPSRLLISKPAQFCGRISYSLYLTHELVGGLTGAVHRFANVLGLPHGQTIGAICAMVVTFPISFLLYKIVEVPGRKYLRRVFEGKPLAMAT